MPRSISSAGLLVFLLVAGCLAASPGWERRDDRSPPSMGDTSDCRDEARRMAIARYPDRQLVPDQHSPYAEDPDRFGAEIRFYEACMQHKGFVRPPTR